MAFRPFEFFRKRQKMFLAALAITAMFLFVLGDPLFGRGGGGNGRSTGIVGKVRRLFGNDPDRVATVAGESLDVYTLMQLRQQRELALRTIVTVQSAGNEAIYKDAGFTDAELRAGASENPLIRKQFTDKREKLQREKPDALRELNTPRDSLASTLMEQVERWPYSAYFDKSESQNGFSPLGLVDFKYWLAKANDLGIVVNNEQVVKDLYRVGAEKISEEDIPNVVARAKLGRDFNTLIGYLADEYRAMMARGTVMGAQRGDLLARLQGRTGGGGPLALQATPYELWEAYAKVKSQLEVGILDVPVNQKEFLDRVPDPTTEELKAYYDKYSKEEPRPESEAPGFKIPKLYQIAFVYGDLRFGTDTAKYYRNWAQAIQALDPTASIAEVVSFYEQNKRFRYRSVEDPQQQIEGVAQLVLGTAGISTRQPTGSSGALPMLRPAENLLSTPSLRLPDVGKLVLGAAGQVTTPVAGFDPGYLPFRNYVEKFLPLENVHAAIVDEISENKMRDLLTKDLEALQKELLAYGKTYQQEFARWRNRPGAKNDKTASFNPPLFTYKEQGQDKKVPFADYLRDWTKARGLTYEMMTEARSRDDLFKEEGKTPLGTLLKPMFFTRSFDDETRSTDFATRQLTESKGLYDGRIEKLPPAKPWEFALHWKVQESEPRTPSFEEAQPRVLQAWKLEKARELAEEQAQQIAKEVEAKKPDGYRILVDRERYAQEKILSRFELAPVGLAGMNYRPATVPVVEHPTEELVEEAYKKLQEPGDVLVAANKPKTHYYVLVLRNRKEPKVNNSTDVSRFDLEVIAPELGRGLQVNNQPLSEFVLEEKRKTYYQAWDKYLRDVTKFDDKNAEALKNAREL